MMKSTPIDDRLSVAGQPSPADIAMLGRQGVTLLINNRPDDEEPGQPGSDAEREAAAEAGIGYLHLPVTGASLSRSDIDRFREAVLAAPGPVVAHCRSGTRSLMLWAIGEVLAGRLPRDRLLDYGHEHGIDLSGAARWLDTDAAKR